MPTPPSEIIPLLSTFSVAFTARTFAKSLTLLYGTLLAPGRRTVAAALRAVGLIHDRHFTNYHRVLNRDRWSPWVLSKLLLSLIISLCLAPEMPLILIIDDTLERRQGRRIRYKGTFYDAVRSTLHKASISLGIRWVCLAALVPVPWSPRLWALPFMVVPALSAKTSAQLKKLERTPVDWAGWMVDRVRRWQPERDIHVIGDGAYAAIELVQRCQQLRAPVKLVSRLRLDAQLYEQPGPRPQGKRGPKPKKGAKQPHLAERLLDPTTRWQTLTIPWYSGTSRPVEIITGVSLWHRGGYAPVLIRWVLLRCPEATPKSERFKPAALFTSDPTLAAEQIIRLFISRWNIEITFEELRSFLGFETQRQWSDRAIERTTPCLFGIFSVVVLWAKLRHADKLPVRQTPWYPKSGATFSDVLAAVRCDLWAMPNYVTSGDNPDVVQLPKTLVFSLFEMAYYSV
jgi:DDE superfamily endonuclease